MANEVLSWQGVQKLWQRIKEYVKVQKAPKIIDISKEVLTQDKTLEIGETYVVCKYYGHFNELKYLILPENAKEGDCIVLINVDDGAFKVKKKWGNIWQEGVIANYGQELFVYRNSTWQGYMMTGNLMQFSDL